MKRPLISVCVPTYNRSDSLEQLINSFLNQDYSNKELIISDDSTNNNVESLLNEYNVKEIKYFKNKKNIGFSKNLYSAISKANGKYLVILGDDDLFFSKSALSEYVKAFSKDKKIGYVYSNQVQFTNDLEIQYEINMFPRNKIYNKGVSSLENIWLTSIFIGGLALLNKKDCIKKWYSKSEILHPQVELVGHYLLNYNSYVIKKNLIGFRSRESQIIFRALKDKKIKKAGKHQNVELFEIYHRLRKKYILSSNTDFLAKKLIDNSLVFLPKEKMLLGNKIFLENYQEFNSISSYAKHSLKLKLIVLFSLLTPSYLIKILRDFSFLIVKILNKNLFLKYKKDLNIMIIYHEK